MQHDFATRIERRHPRAQGQTPEWPSMKWNRYAPDVLPLWVADMDFVSPPPVMEALHARVDHGVFGYGEIADSLRETSCAWSSEHYAWHIESDWQLWLPGVVPALHIASLALTEPGDGVLTVTPIYPPFLKIADNTGRLKQTAPLAEPKESGDPWRIDLEALEQAITPATRLLLWCHPHNPTGRVWDEQELVGLAELVRRHDLLVVSDELHCDLLLDEGVRHRPLAAMFPDLASRLVTLWAPSKTFNLAGLSAACAVISDAKLRARFAAKCRGLMPETNVLGLVAAEAAYGQSESWRQTLLATLRENRAQLIEAVSRWPGVEMNPPQSTYLAWLDMRRAGLGENPQRTLLEESRVALSDGADFGWPGFVRLNFGTTPSQVNEALARLEPLLNKAT